jgi:hypothetical protein
MAEDSLDWRRRHADHVAAMRIYVLPLLLIASALAAADSVYVTAFRDPCRALEVHRLAKQGAPIEPLSLTRDGQAPRSVAAVALSLPGTAWVIHRALLDGLEPATTYGVNFGSEPVQQVRTVPADFVRPLRVITGGDTMHKPEWLAKTTKVLGARDPDLIVLGGDLAYEDGRNGERVATWIQTWSAAALAPDGRLLPFMSCIGNHEVQGHYGASPAQAPFFYAMLPLEGRANHAVDVGTEVSFILLDTDHTTRIPGPQTDWLAAALAERKARPTVIPVYHYPAWPTVKVGKGEKDPTDNRIARLIRQHWVPLFESAGVRLALEHDQHSFKRTVPLKAGVPDPAGITYLGDGAWGVDTRPIYPGLSWLANSGSLRHGYLLEIHGGGRIVVTAIDENGKVFDGVEVN